MTDKKSPDNSTFSSTVIDMHKAAMKVPMRDPDGKPLPRFMTYSPPARYLVEPCRVITLHGKKQP